MALRTSRTSSLYLLALVVLLFSAATVRTDAQNRGRSAATCAEAPDLSGTYQIDADESDKLYSVIGSATSKVPYGEQQEFFMDLAVRLTPPDLLEIECRGNQIFLGSSRAPRIAFRADGVTRSTKTADGRTVQTRISFERDSLVFTSDGSGADKLSFTFTPFDDGEALEVIRQISAPELIEPVVIKTVYNKIDTVARWDIYNENRVGERSTKPPPRKTPPSAAPVTPPVRAGDSAADSIRQLLYQWIEATNKNDIGKQMSFYMPELKAFYLTRNASINSVRAEKVRVFGRASLIDIRADQPEIVFQDAGQTAVMRFRKKYTVKNAAKTSRGEVIQELRWQQTSGGWKIFSERDIRVLS